MLVKENSVVGLEYTLREAGQEEVLDTNVDGELLVVVIGSGAIIPGLESAVLGKNQGDSFDVVISADEAYGQANGEAIQTLPKEQFAGIELEEGMSLYGEGNDGEVAQVTVKSFDDENVIIDYNHPLAGKSLSFNVAIKEVRDATTEEIEQGQVAKKEESGCCSSGGCGC